MSSVQFFRGLATNVLLSANRMEVEFHLDGRKMTKLIHSQEEYISEGDLIEVAAYPEFLGNWVVTSLRVLFRMASTHFSSVPQYPNSLPPHQTLPPTYANSSSSSPSVWVFIGIALFIYVVLVLISQN